MSRPSKIQIFQSLLGAVVVAITIAVAGCSGDGGEPATPERFESVDAFVQSKAARSKNNNRVVVIGVDAAGWEFLDPHIESGALPNFARIKQEGAWGILRSTDIDMTPPAWTAMFSGVLPERTGVYTFGVWDKEKRQFLNVLADDVEVPRVWDVAAHAGRRVAVVNVPVTYPPSPVNGIMISGMMTPNEPIGTITLVEKNSPFIAEAPPDPDIVSHSPVRSLAAGDPLNTFIWMLYDTVDDGRMDYDRVTITVLPEEPLAVSAEDWVRYSFDVGMASPWIKIRVAQDGALIDGWCRLGMDESFRAFNSETFVRIDETYTYPDELAADLETEFGYYLPTKTVTRALVSYVADDAARQAVALFEREEWDLYVYVFTQSDNVHHVAGYQHPALEVYQHLDRTLGVIMDQLGDDGVLIVASDHGTGRFDYGIDLNHVFADAGLLKWESDGEIDFENTIVFHNLWHLYFNHDLLTPEALAERGIDATAGETPAASLARHLAQLGESLQDENGKPIAVQFRPIPEDAVGNPPDMSVHGSFGEYLVVFWNFESPQQKAVVRLEGKAQWWHQRDGIVLAWGKGIRRNLDLGATDIQNVAPTIMYALGVPVAENLDGTVIDTIFEPRTLARLPLYLVGDYSGVVTARSTGTEREDLKKKLKSLGYIQ